MRARCSCLPCSIPPRDEGRRRLSRAQDGEVRLLQRGTIVLATVKGDVHDIGKNLVDIILSNNGYKVVNLGIKQPSDLIIAAQVTTLTPSAYRPPRQVHPRDEVRRPGSPGIDSRIPVICGGAALTRKYVEDDLRREYSASVFYAEDAFAGLHVMSDLTDADTSVREKRLLDGATVKTFIRPGGDIAPLPASTSSERSAIVHDVPEIPQPPFFGVRVRKDFDLDTLYSFINETALFKNQWQLKTASATDYVRLVEEKYRPILEELLRRGKREGWFEPKVVYGWFPAQSEGNDVIVYDPEDYEPADRFAVPSLGASHAGRSGEATQSKGLRLSLATDTPRELLRITFPRQREGRLLSIADFFSPKNQPAAWMSSASPSSPSAAPPLTVTQKLFEAGDFTKYLYLHGLSVETAEALAEYMHKQMREDLGIAEEDSPETRDLFHQKYRGSRYSFGYPACPNLEDQTKIFDLLKPEENIGVRLTEGFHLEPEQSTDALIVHHPQAKYFVV